MEEKIEYILVSSCLLGSKTRYDGKDCYLKDIEKVKEKYNIIPICPEVMSGLKTPRYPIELNKNNQAFDKSGKNLTNKLNSQIEKIVYITKLYNIKFAILKEKSPCCGVYYIYDGQFNGNLINGSGLLTQKLKENNVIVYSEKDIEKLV